MQSVLAKLAEVKKLASGVAILSDWIGDGANPVMQFVAERRAITCIACKENQVLGVAAKLTASVAKAILEQVQIKNQIGIKVENEQALNTCAVCLCPLRLKVHVPLEHILAHTTPVTLEKFPANCWIVNEISKPKP